MITFGWLQGASSGFQVLLYRLWPMSDPTERNLWGVGRHHGLMGKRVAVSDDAGQFRILDHACVPVHAQRLLRKRMPKTPEQMRKLERLRDQCHERGRLLARLHRRKHERLRVLGRPEIPLHANASENDLRPA